MFMCALFRFGALLLLLLLLLLLIYFKLTNLQTIPYKNIQYKIAKQRG